MSSSPKPSVMICVRTRRTRSTSTCASAMRTAAAWRAAPAPSPAMRAASATTSAASAGSASTGWLSPWRSALRATAALPARVRGPVEHAALARLAARTAALAMRARPGHPLGALELVASRRILAAHHRRSRQRESFDGRISSGQLACHCHMTSRARFLSRIALAQ
jgi:hypothetical protein